MTTGIAFQKSKHLISPKYRADIDGLRAIAVLCVVVFHSFPKMIKGGFIGVDIFFVISGFLISTIIFENMERDCFSFIEFYSRRIKRIFPALLLVLIASYTLGWFVLLSDEYKQLGKHIAGGAGFISNILFWKESGYFDNAAETKPLQHLWSLGIEEQFYLVWPLLLWSAWKQGLNLLTITIIILVISFVLNIGKVHTDAIAAFYSPQTRFWELTAGSVLAYITLFKQYLFLKGKQKLDLWLGIIIYAKAPEANGNTLRNVQSFLGIALIAIGVLVINKVKSFPGWWAVFPTAGTLLIISAGTQAWLNRIILSNRVLVWLGLISFPLYLWHWPLLSFAHIIEGEMPSRKIRIAVVAISIILAWLTFRLIEKPIRFGKNSKAKTITLFVLMMVVGIVGYHCYAEDGLAFRVIQTAQKEKNEIFIYKSHWKGWKNCKYVSALIPSNGGCKILNQDKPTDVIVIGDSHAGHLASGLKEFFSTRKENVAIMLHAGCYPFFPLKMNNAVYFNCDSNLIEKALLFAETTPSVKLIILSGYAALKIQNNRYHEPIGISEEKLINNLTAFNLGLQTTLTRLEKIKKKIIYIVDIPELYKDPKSCIQRTFMLSGSRCSIDISKKDYVERNAAYYKIIKENKEKFPHVYFSNTDEIFCDVNKCYGTKDNVLLYATRDHLTPNGSKYFINGLSKLLSSLLQ